jgi:arginine repressor
LLGTIAGDDTVLVATASRSAGVRVRRRVGDLL